MRLTLSIIVNLAVLLFGFTLLNWATNNWEVWTTESARQRDLVNENYQPNNVSLVNHHGKKMRLYDLSEDILILEFIFTRCFSVCLDMGNEFRKIEHEISNHHDINLLSISFDWQNDNLVDLREYHSRFSGGKKWSVARAQNQLELNDLITKLGVVVLEDPVFGFIHNTAVYVLNQSKIVGIYDYGERSKILEHIKQLSIEKQPHTT